MCGLGLSVKQMKNGLCYGPCVKYRNYPPISSKNAQLKSQFFDFGLRCEKGEKVKARERSQIKNPRSTIEDILWKKIIEIATLFDKYFVSNFRI